MIELFRSFSQSWVARGFFLLLALIFLVMWGGGDWSRQLISHQQSVITVGKETISAWDFFKELNRSLHQVQLSTGQTLDEQKAKELGLYDMISNKLITQKLIELEAARLGIEIRNAEIRALIKGDKIFQDDKGVFQKSRFEAIMKNIGYDEASYVEALRQDLLKGRLVNALTLSTKMPLSVTLPLYAWQNEKRSLTALMLSTDSIIVDKKVTEEELKKFYEERKDKVSAPEYRDVSLLILDQQPLMEALTIQNSDLEAAYRHRDEEFRGKSFEKVKKQVESDLKRQRTLETFEKLINQVEDLLGQGKSLEDISKELSLPLKTYTRIDAQGRSDPFEAKPGSEMDPLDRKAIQEAFTLELEDHTAPLESGPGHYRVARVDRITPAQARTFEEVKRKLNDVWIMTKKLEALKSKADIIAHEINKGSPASVVAAKYKVKTLGSKVDRRGALAPSALTLPEAIIDRIYTLGVGEAISVPYQISEQKGEYAVIQVTRKESPNPQDNKERIEEFQETLAKLFVEDIMSSFVYSLRKRFPVDVNQSFFAKVVK